MQVTMVRKEHTNLLPADDLVLSRGDAILVIAETQADIEHAGKRLGSVEPGRLAKDRSAVDYIRVFVGKANMVGVPLAELPLPKNLPLNVLHVRRYDADLVPSPDLVLEFGDRVGVLTATARKEEVRALFGDTVKAAAEFSYVSLGVGMVLGVLLGLIPIPDSRARGGHTWHWRRAVDRRAHSRQIEADRTDALGDAPARQYRAPQFRSGLVSCCRRH